jgi:outer membrane protein, multidrug efflux system
MNRKVPITFAVVFALTGCTMMPKYERPPLPVPDTYPAAASVEDTAAADSATVPDWHEYFADTCLQAVIERALAGNRDLRIAGLNVERAAALYRIQRGQISPAIGAQGMADEIRLPEKMTSSGNAETQETYAVEVGFMSWEIDLFGRLRSLTKSALEQYLATEQAHRAVHTSLVSAVALSWLRLAADTESLRLAEETIVAQTATRDLVKASRDAGVASDLDLSQAEGQVETARASRAEFAGEVAVDRDALELLVGSPLPDELLPDSLSAVSDFPALAAGLPSEVLLTRPDILAAEHQLQAANANIGAARAAFFPHISLTAALGTLAPAVSNLFDSGTRSWRYTAVAQTPIYAGGGLKANLKAAWVERNIAVAAYEKAIQTAFAEVADALTLRSTLLERREAWDRLLAALEQTYRLSEERYKAGLDGYLGVLVAQRSLYFSQQTGVALRLAEKANQVALYKALGGGT